MKNNDMYFSIWLKSTKVLPIALKERQNIKKTNTEKTEYQKDKDQTESLILWCQGSFALFKIVISIIYISLILSWAKL